MKTFLKNSLRTLGLLLIINLAACSSSDNDYNDSDNNAPNKGEGVWRGSLTFDNVGAAGAVGDDDYDFEVNVIFSDGIVMIIPDDGIIPKDGYTILEEDDLFNTGMYSGEYGVDPDNDEVIGGYALWYNKEIGGFNYQETKGIKMLFTGAETESGVMNLDFDLVYEDDSTIASGTIELVFVDDENGSSKDDIEGWWATDDVGLAIHVEDGLFDNSFLNKDGSQHPCNIEGKISILDPEYNLYDATSTIYDCKGLNGEYIGFAAVYYDNPDDDLLTIIGTDAAEEFMLFIELERDLD